MTTTNVRPLAKPRVYQGLDGKWHATWKVGAVIDNHVLAGAHDLGSAMTAARKLIASQAAPEMALEDNPVLQALNAIGGGS